MNDFKGSSKREKRRKEYVTVAWYDSPERDERKKKNKMERKQLLNEILDDEYDVIIPINGLVTDTIAKCVVELCQFPQTKILPQYLCGHLNKVFRNGYCKQPNLPIHND